MADQNYFEIVAVPVLQRKCQELFNSNMILETNLHMEMTKARHNTEELQRLKSDMASTSATSSADIQVMKAALEDSNKRIQTLDQENSRLKIDLSTLHNQLDKARTELQELQAKLSAAYEKVQGLEAVTPKSAKVIKTKLIEPKDDF